MSELEGLALRIHDYRQGVEHERERIIALLTARAENDDREAYPFVGSTFWSAIALIKGENDA